MFAVFLLNFVFGSNSYNIYFQDFPPTVSVAQNPIEAKQYIQNLDSFRQEQAFIDLQINSTTQWNGYTFYRSTTHISCMPGLLSIEEASKAAKNLQLSYDSVFDSSGKRKNVLPSNALQVRQEFHPWSNENPEIESGLTTPSGELKTAPTTPRSVESGPESNSSLLVISGIQVSIQAERIGRHVQTFRLMDGARLIGALPQNVKILRISGTQTRIDNNQIGSGVEIFEVVDGAKWNGICPETVKKIGISGRQTELDGNQIGSGVARVNLYDNAQLFGPLPSNVSIVQISDPQTTLDINQIGSGVRCFVVRDAAQWTGTFPSSLEIVAIFAPNTILDVNRIGSGVHTLNLSRSGQVSGPLPSNVKTVKILDSQTMLDANRIGSGVEIIVLEAGGQLTGTLPSNVKTVKISCPQTNLGAYENLILQTLRRDREFWGGMFTINLNVY